MQSNPECEETVVQEQRPLEEQQQEEQPLEVAMSQLKVNHPEEANQCTGQETNFEKDITDKEDQSHLNETMVQDQMDTAEKPQAAAEIQPETGNSEEVAKPEMAVEENNPAEGKSEEEPLSPEL